MGLDGVLMKRRMATLGNESASHERSLGENANMLEFDVKMLFEECFSVSSGLYEVVVQLCFPLFLLSDLEEERVELLPPATGTLRANHSGCSATCKDPTH